MNLYLLYRRFNRAWFALFPKKIDEIKVDFHRIQKMPITSFVSMIDVGYEVKLVNGSSFVLRKKPSSDVSVFEQIFGLNEYLPVVGLIKNGLKDQEFVMIDGGANIGMASCYIACHLQIHKLFLIEPLSSNFDLLQDNICTFGLKDISKAYPLAISNSNKARFEISYEFRDGKDWSASVVPNTDGNVKSISIMDIINQNALEYVSYLKLDIEGAERFVFELGSNLDFLDFVKVISIEIHDEYPIRQQIVNTLLSKGFVVFESGEMTIGFKPSLMLN
ncbi:MAG: FkbM family methyltransferase [Arcticibacter sp.]